MAQVVAGIIAEYNPFHNGHAWHIARTRENLDGAAIICVMSGHVTQRGSLAICRKQARAAMAVHGGADLVLELPSPFACASAERFARAGVALLRATGVVTHLSFGSETGALTPLAQMAELLDHPAFLREQAEALRLGVSYPLARQMACETLTGRPAPLLAQPNDILGLEYLRALRRPGADITPLVIPRCGVLHDAPDTAAAFASASFLRKALLRGDEISLFVPDSSLSLWTNEQVAGRAPVDLHACEQAVVSHLRRLTPADFARLPDATEGLDRRLARAARDACSLDSFYTLVKTRRYTHARIRRLALRAYLSLHDAPSRPPYLRVLAANETGCRLLADMKKTAALPVLTKPASIRLLGREARLCFETESRVTDLYALCYPDPLARRGGQEWTTGPVILSKSDAI